jgi:hypothetical protein
MDTTTRSGLRSPTSKHKFCFLGSELTEPPTNRITSSILQQWVVLNLVSLYSSCYFKPRYIYKILRLMDQLELKFYEWSLDV